jgi:hypothetical protein
MSRNSRNNQKILLGPINVEGQKRFDYFEEQGCQQNGKTAVAIVIGIIFILFVVMALAFLVTVVITKQGEPVIRHMDPSRDY